MSTNKIDLNSLGKKKAAPVLEDETLDATIIIRLTATEKQNLKINAKKKRLNMSSYIRNLVHDNGGFEQTEY